jgi:pyrimidine operon attenuation protein/uracil phosphoribosyltransferase
MDFNGMIQTRHADRSPTEVCLLAAEALKQAKKLLGSQSIIIVESVVCDGRGIEECARKLYGVQDGEKIAARDVNYIGRRLRESLDELADLWHPRTRRPRIQGYRPAQYELAAGDAGIRNVEIKPFVMR